MESKQLAVGAGFCLLGLVLVGLSGASFFTADAGMLRNAGNAGGLLLLPALLVFRSKFYLALLKVPGRRPCPAIIRMAGAVLVFYAAAACALFFFHAAGQDFSIGHGILMLAPFGAFAFYMGRWTLWAI